MQLQGQAPAIMERRAGRFRFQLQFFQPIAKALHKLLYVLTQFLEAQNPMPSYAGTLILTLWISSNESQPENPFTFSPLAWAQALPPEPRVLWHFGCHPAVVASAAGTPTWAYMAVLASGFAFGVWICEKTSQDLGVHDHGGIVFDEWIGLWLTLIWLPWGDNLRTIWPGLAQALLPFAFSTF